MAIPVLGIILAPLILYLEAPFNRRRARRAWDKLLQEMAPHLRLNCYNGLSHLTGTYKGFNWQLYLAIEKRYVGSGYKKRKARDHTTTNIIMELPEEKKITLHIFPETLSSKLMKALGALQEIQTDDSLFDKSFIICTDQPEEAKKILTTEIRKELLREKRYINILLHEKSVTSITEGVLCNTKKIASLTEVIWQIARNISEEKDMKTHCQPL